MLSRWQSPLLECSSNCWSRSKHLFSFTISARKVCTLLPKGQLCPFTWEKEILCHSTGWGRACAASNSLRPQQWACSLGLVLPIHPHPQGPPQLPSLALALGWLKPSPGSYTALPTVVCRASPKDPQFVALADFSGVNIPPLANFKLPA